MRLILHKVQTEGICMRVHDNAHCYSVVSLHFTLGNDDVSCCWSILRLTILDPHILLLFGSHPLVQ